MCVQYSEKKSVVINQKLKEDKKQHESESN